MAEQSSGSGSWYRTGSDGRRGTQPGPNRAVQCTSACSRRATSSFPRAAQVAAGVRMGELHAASMLGEGARELGREIDVLDLRALERREELAPVRALPVVELREVDLAREREHDHARRVERGEQRERDCDGSPSTSRQSRSTSRSRSETSAAAPRASDETLHHDEFQRQGSCSRRRSITRASQSIRTRELRRRSRRAGGRGRAPGWRPTTIRARAPCWP